MYNNGYSQYNPQTNLDRINAQIQELEKMKQQVQQPIQPAPNVTQNFQISPINREVIRYANNIQEVERDMVIGDTPFFSKDMSVVWVKNTKGEIKSYELNEIVPKDSRDIQIEYLQAQIEELKGMINNDANVTNVDTEQSTTNTTRDDETNGESVKKNKSTSIQKVSGSKKE